MKKIFFWALLSITGTASYSQKQPVVSSRTIQKNDSADKEIAVYNLAVKYRDYEVAKNALYNLMVKYPNNINYLDSLVRLYFTIGLHSQVIWSGTEYLAKDPDNLFILETVAISYNALQKSKEALEIYEKLYKSTKNTFHAYQIALLQYVLKRHGECSATIASVLTDTISIKQIIHIPFDKEQSQQVPLHAAILNLRGVLEKDLNQNEQAKNSFKEALKIFPNFVLAKGNLDYINQQVVPSPTPTPTQEIKPDVKEKNKK